MPAPKVTIVASKNHKHELLFILCENTKRVVRHNWIAPSSKKPFAAAASNLSTRTLETNAYSHSSFTIRYSGGSQAIEVAVQVIRHSNAVFKHLIYPTAPDALGLGGLDSPYSWQPSRQFTWLLRVTFEDVGLGVKDHGSRQRKKREKRDA